MSDPPIRVGDLAAAAPSARLFGSGDPLVTGVVYDSRQVSPGSLFAALPGSYQDGHRFAETAVERGAVALLVERTLDVTVPQIVAPSSRQALAHVAAAYYRYPSQELRVIGITGTDGKTTTSFLVDDILRSAGCQTGLIGTVAVRIGDEVDAHPSRQTTPESADIQRLLRTMVDRGVAWATVEATSHGLAMHRLDETRVRLAGVTNITSEHLDFHGTVDNYRRSKGILFERVGSVGGTVAINLDDEGARTMRSHSGGATVLTYSAEGRSADVRATEIMLSGDGSRFVLDSAAFGQTPVELPMIGRFNVANALCAATLCLAAGIDIDCVAAGLGQARPVSGRMELVRSGQPFSVVVDYAHTPEAMAHVLPLLRGLHPNGRLIVVFGSAGERDLDKRPRQGAVAARLADLAIVTTEDPRFEDPEAIVDDIVRGAIAAGAVEGKSLLRVVDRRQAVRAALERARPGDCILLAGKGHEQSIIWGAEKLPWDEVEVARAILHELGYAH